MRKFLTVQMFVILVHRQVSTCLLTVSIVSRYINIFQLDASVNITIELYNCHDGISQLAVLELVNMEQKQLAPAPELKGNNKFNYHLR